MNFYIAAAKPGENIDGDSVTASIFTAEKDGTLFTELEAEGRIRPTERKGIYLVTGMTDIPLQIVITDELEGSEYASYRVLTGHAAEKDVDFLLDRLRNETDQNSRDRIHRILGLVETKNSGMVAKKIEEDKEMRDVFMDILKPEIDERISQHDRNNLYDFVREGDMQIENAARRAGITVEQFQKQMDEYLKSQKSLQAV